MIIEAKDTLLTSLKNCTLCPRRCAVDRTGDERGICQTGRFAKVASWGPHFGEESPLVGTYGSGTIFFSYCNLLCTFCQNYSISHFGEGRLMKPDELANIMLELQNRGCHNINLVTPSHVVPQVVEALETAKILGLIIPVVYNTSGYDLASTLKLLDGVIDIYMPDIKFLNKNYAAKACDAPDYPAVVKESIKEMHRQVGDLEVNQNGIARKGLLVRHLVMPDQGEDSRRIIDFVVDEISPTTYLNIMSQYYPSGATGNDPSFNRRISTSEYRTVVDYAVSRGLKRLDR